MKYTDILLYQCSSTRHKQFTCFLHAYRKKWRVNNIQSATIDFHINLLWNWEHPRRAHDRDAPTIFVTASESASREGTSEPLRRSHLGGHRMVIQWNSVIKSEGYQPIWDNLGPFHEGQLVWAERVRRVWCMCYVGGYSLGLARGSYCDHNVVGTIWEIDVGWAKQLGSGQSSVADHADRSGVDRDLGLFGNKLDGLSDREWHQFAIFLSTIDEDSISFLSI